MSVYDDLYYSLFLCGSDTVSQVQLFRFSQSLDWLDLDRSHEMDCSVPIETQQAVVQQPELDDIEAFLYSTQPS